MQIRLVKWTIDSGEWNDIRQGRKVDKVRNRERSTAPLSSTPNTCKALHSANLEDNNETEVTPTEIDANNSKLKVSNRKKRELNILKQLDLQMRKLAQSADKESFWDHAIAQVTDKHIDFDKAGNNNICQVSVTEQRNRGLIAPSILQQTCNIEYAGAPHMTRVI